MIKLFKTLRTISNNRKRNLIYKLGYQYFYDTFEPDTYGIHIPPFIQKEQREEFARVQTNIHLKQIIENQALDKCYKSARRYERKLLANKLKNQLSNLTRKFSLIKGV